MTNDERIIYLVLDSVEAALGSALVNSNVRQQAVNETLAALARIEPNPIDKIKDKPSSTNDDRTYPSIPTDIFRK